MSFGILTEFCEAGVWGSQADPHATGSGRQIDTAFFFLFVLEWSGISMLV